VVFMSEIAGVVTTNKNAAGVLIANKYGFNIIRAKIILNATEDSCLYHLTEKPSDFNSQEQIISYTLEYEDVKNPIKKKYRIPEKFNIFNDQIILHPGQKKQGHVFVEFAIKVGSIATTRERIKWELAARKQAIALAQYLKNEVTSFANAIITQISQQGVFSNLMEDDNKKIQQLKKVDGYQNFFSAAFALKLRKDLTCTGLNQLNQNAEQIANDIILYLQYNSQFELLNLSNINDYIIKANNLHVPLDLCQTEESCNKFLRMNMINVNFKAEDFLQVKEQCDVLVVGGGTAGVPAGIAAALNKQKVIIAEINSGLGGTQSFGLVAGYYHGYKKGYTVILDQKVKQLENIFARPVAKMLTYENEFVNNQGNLYLNTMISDSIMEKDSIKGVVAVNRDGMFIITSKVTIDATGDADVAVFCGVDYEMGDPRTGNLQNYSQWGKGPIGPSDLDVINNDQFSEMLRGLYLAHYKNDNYDFAPMLTVRESRRIKGDYYLNMTDVLTKKHFKDVIALASTDSDQHGVTSSWLARMGYTPYHGEEIQLEIPYRACLPSGINGLLITGKALSGSRDAVAYARMVPDIQNRGYAMGLAAAMAVNQDCDLRKIDIDELQGKLKEIGILPQKVLDEKSIDLITEEEINKKIEELVTGDYKELLAVILMPQEPTLQLLEVEYRRLKDKKDKINLAKALAWFGSQTGVSLLINRLQKLNEKEGILSYSDRHPTKPGNNKGGILHQIDDYWRINQLLILLGLAQAKEAVNIICNITEKTSAGGEPVRRATNYVKKRIDLQRIPHYDRVLSLCFALERLADNSAIKPLENLLDKPYMSGYVSRDFVRAGRSYVCAYLEVVIARTLARCGGVKGAFVLVEYLEDIHSILAEHAYCELKAVTGKDFGYNQQEWRNWLYNKEQLTTVRYWCRI
ncbi:MAG: FAD-dependent oxidoreductase, partial [Bacillota bacterium]